MDNFKENLELYSISQAARLLKIARSNLRRLIAEGKIGIIQVNKRQKITFRELVSFQNNWTMKKKEVLSSPFISGYEVKRFFENQKGGKSSTPPDTKLLLKKIMEGEV